VSAINRVSRFLCTEGDSNSAHDNSIVYPYVFGPNASPTTLGINLAVSGSTIASLNSRAAQVDAMLPPVVDRAGRTFILTCLIGTNDLVGYSGGNSAWLSALGAYYDARTAAGWTKVIGATLLPCGVTVGFNAARNTVNPSILAFVGTKLADCMDFGGDATIGPDSVSPEGGSWNGTLMSDGKHLTATGQNIAEGIARTVINRN